MVASNKGYTEGTSGRRLKVVEAYYKERMVVMIYLVGDYLKSYLLHKSTTALKDYMFSFACRERKLSNLFY